MRASSLLARAPAPLALPTYEGSGQCVHPDVIRVDRAVCGCDLLMAMEPYPFADAAFENPSLLGSDDGRYWFVPEGVHNPVVPPPEDPAAWHSDADLVVGRGGELQLYYRYNRGMRETSLLRRTSGDARTWSDAERVFTVAPSGRFASPALVRVDDRYYMYYVDTASRCVRMTWSRDGRCWNGDAPLFAFEAAWHLDATRDGEWTYLLLNDDRSLFLLRSRDPGQWALLDHQAWRPHPAATGSATEPPTPILEPSADSWDNALLYRSSLLVEDGRVRLWYGGKSTENIWQVGYTDGCLPE